MVIQAEIEEIVKKRGPSSVYYIQAFIESFMPNTVMKNDTHLHKQRLSGKNGAIFTLNQIQRHLIHDERFQNNARIWDGLLRACNYYVKAYLPKQTFMLISPARHNRSFSHTTNYSYLFATCRVHYPTFGDNNLFQDYGSSCVTSFVSFESSYFVLVLPNTIECHNVTLYQIRKLLAEIYLLK
ncbi:hypothetical protein BDA99DRAFT_543111 [Phascolomyces articulosus]|uniref:Uncharacterized protein n=1 Tax=Phascolomyces articulosus TaxID=60185 RepID=A0AAD5JYM4_9FUNG|nr:hypothetical protein BDA99DRAFT_543111 [Phascolomyces articulosus]